MKVKRILFLVLIPFFLGLVPIGCIDDCGGSGGPSSFEITKWGISTVEIESVSEVDTSTAFHFPVDSIAKKVFIKEQKFISSKAQPSRFSFYNTAFACDPIPPQSIHSIKSIKILSRKNLTYLNENDTVEPGENISNRFRIIGGYYSDGEMNLEKFISENFKPFSGDFFLLKAADSPYQPVTLNFDVIITMTDNTVFELKDQIMKVR